MSWKRSLWASVIPRDPSERKPNHNPLRRLTRDHFLGALLGIPSPAFHRGMRWDEEWDEAGTLDDDAVETVVTKASSNRSVRVSIGRLLG